jgi:hypothetical protein
MKLKEWFFIGLAGLVYLAIRAKDNILNQLTVSLAGIVPDIRNLRLKIKLNIYNPLPNSIPITAITGKISVKNTDLADYMNTDGFTLVSGGNVVELNAFPLFANVISSSSELLKGRIDFKYTITSGPLSYTSTVIYNI